MNNNPSHWKKGTGAKPVKKTIVINCFTGEEREVDRHRIKIIDGMEVGNTRVQLDNGMTLAVVGEGKYHTLGNPGQRWAEVAQVRVLPDGEYGDGELLGWTPLDKPAPHKNGQSHSGPAKPAPKTPKKAGAQSKTVGKFPSPDRAGKTKKNISPSSGKLPPRPKRSRT